MIGGVSPIRFIGFDTTRTPINTDANRPTITTATNSIILLNFNAAEGLYFRNFIFTQTAATSAVGIANATAASGTIVALEFVNCKWGSAFTSVYSSTTAATKINARFVGCEMTATTGSTFNLGTATIMSFESCWIHDNAAVALNFPTGSSANIAAVRSIIVDNGTRGVFFAGTTGAGSTAVKFHNCTIANNTTSQIEADQTTGAIGNVEMINCILYGTVAIDLATAGTDKYFTARTNAFSGTKTNFTTGQGDIALSGDPFTNAASDDYSLDNTAGEGAACRGDGWPGVFPGGLTTGYVDVGAVQHADPAGGGQKSSVY